MNQSTEIKEWQARMVDQVLNRVLEPRIVCVEERNGRYYPVIKKNNKKIISKKEVKLRKIGDWNYEEEIFYFPVASEVKKRGLKFTQIEIDGLLLRYFYPDKQFDAFDYDKFQGFDALYNRISGGLFQCLER